MPRRKNARTRKKKCVSDCGNQSDETHAPKVDVRTFDSTSMGLLEDSGFADPHVQNTAGPCNKNVFNQWTSLALTYQVRHKAANIQHLASGQGYYQWRSLRSFKQGYFQNIKQEKEGIHAGIGEAQLETEWEAEGPLAALEDNRQNVQPTHDPKAFAVTTIPAQHFSIPFCQQNWVPF